MTRSRSYVFTINNYTKKNLADLLVISKSLEKHNFIGFGLEIAPTTKTKHIQGYIELNEAMTFSAVQKYFNLKKRGKLVKFHLESARASYEKNKKYYSKDSDEIFEFGEPKKQGVRSDLNLVRETIKENPKILREFVLTADIGYQAIKFAETLQSYVFQDRNPREPPIVIWLYGASGTGKTKLVYDSFDSVCSVSDYNWLGQNYEQQTCLLLDDFRRSDLSFNFLLRITDRYPLSLPKKGGFVPLNSPYIVITTPNDIRTTYDDLGLAEDLIQLERRVLEINISTISVKKLSEITHENYENFKIPF